MKLPESKQVEIKSIIVDTKFQQNFFNIEIESFSVRRLQIQKFIVEINSKLHILYETDNRSFHADVFLRRAIVEL